MICFTGSETESASVKGQSLDIQVAAGTADVVGSSLFSLVLPAPSSGDVFREARLDRRDHAGHHVATQQALDFGLGAGPDRQDSNL